MRVAVGVVAFSLGCGASTPTAVDAPSPEENGFEARASAPPEGDGCAPAARLVYVISEDDDLYSFAPSTVTFTRIGRLACATDLGHPNSMAIDRSGKAWVNTTDGSLFEVSTKDASCKPTPFSLGPDPTFKRFGMAFVGDPKKGGETLYVSGLTERAGGGYGLGTIDLGTFALTMLGDYTGAFAGLGAELTGTGDGRLFGFFATAPATLAEIDPAKSEARLRTQLDGVATGGAWAFTFWGGDFWFYTAGGEGPSQLTRFETKGNSLEVLRADVGGFRVVGAGVSTCAPTSGPR